MFMRKVVISVIIAAAVIVGGVLASPLFYKVEVNEPLPVALENLEQGLTLEKFSIMDEQERQVIVDKMPQSVIDMMMEESASLPTIVSEDMDDIMGKDSEQPDPRTVLSGTFEGLAGHNAMGVAKIIQVNDMTFLRFENFEVTNGPDLRVYITSGGDIHKGVHLEKLKGSKGDQNYLLENIDLGVYDTVVIYCQPFGVYFGKAPLA
jgi:hypothetical protein